MSRKQLVLEPSTLVYTLLDPNVLKFADFSLIVRSLHSYMVDTITPHEEQNNIHVKLNYQASVKNAQIKLGSLRNVICVSKTSSFIKESEFSRLDELRRQFDFGATDDLQQPSTSKHRRSRKFAPRAAPYSKAPTYHTPSFSTLSPQQIQSYPQRSIDILSSASSDNEEPQHQ